MRFRSAAAALLLALPTLSHSFELGEGELHGFVSQGYAKSDSNNYLTDTNDGSFDFNEAGLNYTLQLTDSLHGGIQFFGRNLGRFGGNEVMIDWAFVDWRIEDYFGIRAGKVKLPYGFHNKSRDADVARTFIFLPQGVYDETFRDFILGLWGVDFYGHVDLEKFGAFDYEAYIGTVNIEADEIALSDAHRSTQAGLQSMGIAVASIRNPTSVVKYTAGGQLIWQTPLEGLRLGGTIAWGNLVFGFDFADPMTATSTATSSTDMNIFTYALSAEFSWKQFLATFEYAVMDIPLKVRTIVPSMAINTFSKSPNRREGWYGSLEYFLRDDITLGGYYSSFCVNLLSRTTGPARSQKDAALTLRYDINEYLLVKLEGHYMNGYGLLSTFDNPNGFSKSWYLGLAKVSASF